MTVAIDFIFDRVGILFNTLNSAQFDFYGYRVGLGSIMLCLVIVSIVASVFWKGARG